LTWLGDKALPTTLPVVEQPNAGWQSVQSDLVPRLRDPAILNAFAALADNLRKVMDQIALGKDADQAADTVRYGRL
jgi:hypothetical protein